MSDPNASTASSLADSARSTVSAAAARVTGNPADQRDADVHQAKAEEKSALSSTAAKIGPYTATPEGGVAKDDSRRSEGQWNQTMGSTKEAVGNLVGAESLKKQGQEQNAMGKDQEAQGQLADLGKGVSDRVVGAVGGAVASITGDAESRKHYEEVHDQGKAQQRGAEVDITKQAEK